ncbi:MAG: hypothetical protein LBR61_06700 [Synergistaceae bacterium]|nr:hypothetical protein [Synergistaceae bacterium]
MKTERELLQVLGNAFVEGSVEELLPLLTNDCLYYSDLSGITSAGKNAIAQRWAEVNARQPEKVPYFFKIVPTASLVNNRDALPKVFTGNYCMKLAYRTPDNLLALGFIAIDENSLISEINISRNPKYVHINALLKDSPMSVQPIAPRDPDVETVTIEELLRAFHSEETVAKMMKERQKRANHDTSVYIWREADRFMERWLPDNGYGIIHSITPKKQPLPLNGFSVITLC